jgi:purine-binding chemotaxis protein CheW
MDRATRIREMREGQRETVNGDGEDDADSSADDAAAADAAEATATEEEASGGAADTDESEPEVADADAAETHAADESAGQSSGPAAQGSGSQPAPSTGQEAGDSQPPDGQQDGAGQPAQGGGTGDEDAMAAAQRAAQHAAQLGDDQLPGGNGNQAAAAGGQQAGKQQSPAQQPQAGAQQGGGNQLGAQGPTGVDLPNQEMLQAAVGDQQSDGSEGIARGARRSANQQSSSHDDTVRVLEFTLGEEYYCLDISHVEEIVKRDSITRVPNTPDYVEGVVDLRGQITTILNPKHLLDIDASGEESLLVVFDPDDFEDQGAIGWVVDAVRQVVPIAESEINKPPVEEAYIEGVVDREEAEGGEFVIWVDPETAIEQATREEDEDGN